MSIDRARLRPLDLYRMFEALSEQPALGWLLDELASDFRDMAMHAFKADEREFARQKHLAILDVRAALQAKIEGYKLEAETEMEAERAKQEAAA